MNNENFSNNNIIDNTYIIDNATSLAAYDYYDYTEVVERLDNIIDNQNKSFNLINEGFTFISFLVIIYFLYIFIKNMIRK